MPSRHMVVTGTSTGLGRAVVEEALRRGWSAAGTVRRDEDAEAIAALGAKAVLCDVTDATSVARAAVEITEWSHDSLDVLVNNAGTAYPGPIEILDLDDLRSQLEVNVVGQIAVTQALFPLLRQARGRVVMVSSGSAGMTPPILGAYAASKRALEALAEALDLETRRFGVRTLVVRPGAFDTAIWDTSTARGSRYETTGSEYADLIEQAKEIALDPGRMRDPRDLARTLVDHVESSRPRFRRSIPRTLDTVIAPLVPHGLFRALVDLTMAGRLPRPGSLGTRRRKD